MIAADSDPKFTPIVMQSCVLYQHKGALYAVPILTFDAPEFLAQRRERQKQETLRRARKIGIALMMYADFHDNSLPPVGSDMASMASMMSLLSRYLDDNADNRLFENPATGRIGFTATYKSVGRDGAGAPAETAIGTFQGTGGHAVIYADGHVTWKDDA